MVLEQGWLVEDRVPPDGRLLEGAVQIDASALTGESLPVERGRENPQAPPLASPDLVFSGTLCTGGGPEHRRT